MSMSLADRLKECRLESGLSQSAFGKIGCVNKGSQINYESGKRKPNSDYLSRLWLAGFDTQYLLTGVRFVRPQAPKRDPNYSDEGWTIFMNGWEAYAKSLIGDGLDASRTGDSA